MYVERAADDVLSRGEQLFFYFFSTYILCHYSLYKCGIKGKLGTFPTR